MCKRVGVFGGGKSGSKYRGKQSVTSGGRWVVWVVRRSFVVNGVAGSKPGKGGYGLCEKTVY